MVIGFVVNDEFTDFYSVSGSLFYLVVYQRHFFGAGSHQNTDSSCVANMVAVESNILGIFNVYRSRRGRYLDVVGFINAAIHQILARLPVHQSFFAGPQPCGMLYGYPLKNKIVNGSVQGFSLDRNYFLQVWNDHGCLIHILCRRSGRRFIIQGIGFCIQIPLFV